MSKFHERIKELREGQNLPQKELARLIGYYQQNISDWESGGHEPTTAAIIACALYFDVTSDFLLGLENEDGTRNVDLSSLVIPAQPKKRNSK